jgi:hypothetical protein
MKSCFAIGIGGTGSKCLEAFLHTCVAGLGPEKATIAIIDQDRSNGNVARLRQLLDAYQQLRRNLRGNGSRGVDSGLFHTEIRALTDPVWSPLPEQRVTLETHFNYHALRREARLLFDALFEAKNERAQPLDEGFRGRPAVGAAAMYSEAARQEGFWTDLFQELKDSASDSDIRICIFASIFGGTGAAGFPTISRVIKDAATRHRGQVSIGGVLLLPYFTFPDARSDENLARAKDFLHTTQQALLYYHELLTQSHRGLFDHLYLLGTQRPFTLPNLGAGSNRQVNPSLLPELLAALGAMHFFRQGLPNQKDQKSSLILRGGHHGVEAPAAPEITWDDIPRVNTDGKIHDVRENLGRLVRFAVSYLSFYRPCLLPVPPRGIIGQIWFHNLITRSGVNLGNDHVQETLAALDRYCELLVNWCFDLSRRRDPGDLAVRLFEFDGYTSEQTRPGNEATAMKGGRRAFDRLVTVPRPRSLADVFYSISSVKCASNWHGIGTFVDQLFAACRL